MAFLGGIGFGLGAMVVFALLCLGLCCVMVILEYLMQAYFLKRLLHYLLGSAFYVSSKLNWHFDMIIRFLIYGFDRL